MPKVGPHGLPLDSLVIKRINYFIGKILPYSVVCKQFESFVNGYLDHSLYNLKPKHRILAQHPTANDSLPIKLLSGVVVTRGNVKTFTENGVIFEGEEVIIFKKCYFLLLFLVKVV